MKLVRVVSDRRKIVEDLIKLGLLTDGVHHKQYVLQMLALVLEVDLTEIKNLYEDGIAP